MASASRRTDDELDEFMRADVREGKRQSALTPHRIFLTSAVVFALGWLAVDWIDEVRYHFGPSDVMDLGVVDLDPDAAPPPVGAYVRVQGVLGNKAATLDGLRPGSLRWGPVQVRQLMGARLFVEFDQNALVDRYQPFTRVTVEGRVADFSPTSEIRRVREYLEREQRIAIPKDARVLIVGEKPGAMWTYVIALLVSALVALFSIAGLVRAALTRVVVEEDAPA